MNVKTAFVKDYGYAGIFNWSFDGDKSFKLLNITK
jgi:GH18 family chitinase